MRFVKLYGFSGAVLLAMCLLPHTATATPILTTSTNSDGSKYAITALLESTSATEKVYDITLWADTSGNTLGPQMLDAVAVGINLAGGSMDVVLDHSPSGDWVGEAGGLDNAGCTGTGAFICAHAGTQLATPHVGLYTWTWDIHVPLTFTFDATGGVKISYSTINGHNVSDEFDWHVGCLDCGPEQFLVTTPEPATLALFGTGLALAAFGLRRRRTS